MNTISKHRYYLKHATCHFVKTTRSWFRSRSEDYCRASILHDIYLIYNYSIYDNMVYFNSQYPLRQYTASIFKYYLLSLCIFISMHVYTHVLLIVSYFMPIVSTTYL